jgi:hypothetical protein
MTGKRTSKPLRAAPPPVLEHASNDRPLPGGLRYTLTNSVEILVSNAAGIEVDRFELEDRDLLRVAQQAHRRRLGIRDGRRDKLSETALAIILTVESYARQYPRDSSLSAGALARRLAEHAAVLGVSDRLTDDGPLWDACVKLLVLWRQQDRCGAG